MFRVAETLTRLLAPILSHTAEEVWGPGGGPSPQLAHMPVAEPEKHAEVLARWEPLLSFRYRVINPAMEGARQNDDIGNPIEARVELFSDDQSIVNELKHFGDNLTAVFKVSQVASLPKGSGKFVNNAGVNNVFGRYIIDEKEHVVIVQVTHAPGVKCARCWLIKEDVRSNASHSDLCARCATVVESLVKG